MRAANTDQDMEPDEDGGQGDHRRNGTRASAMKALKLPPFNEDKDDLDAYLIRFERACVAFEVRPQHWLTKLARLLQGKSLEVYQRLPDSDVKRYDVLNSQAAVVLYFVFLPTLVSHFFRCVHLPTNTVQLVVNI